MSEPKSIAHVVLLQSGPDEPVSNDPLLESLVDRLANLATTHGAVAEHAGRNRAPESFTGGFSHGFVATFPDVAALDSYLRAPAHDGLVLEMNSLHLGALVLDLIVREKEAP